jgi:hypothetical protein
MRLAGRTVLLAAAGAVATGGVLAARRGRGSGAHAALGGATKDRWHTLTVNRPVAEVSPDGRPPEPIASVPGVEVRITEAPGGRGTEIAARLVAWEPSAAEKLRDRVTGDDPRWAVRKALRETRSLLETGEVLLPDSPPTTKPTVLNRPLEKATAHGREEGLL